LRDTVGLVNPEWGIEVDQTISPHDEMLQHKREYRSAGASALASIRFSLEAAGIEQVRRILDLPCGHGRVLRWLRAAWPDARIVACDINRDGVDFCVEQFGAAGRYSNEKFEIDARWFDLIWTGSLLTHLNESQWRRYFEFACKHLRGVLVFTTAGGFVAREMRRAGNHPGLSAATAARLLDDFERTGFGYADYRGQKGYGLARATPAWVLSLLSEFPLGVVHLAEQAWVGRQDVYAVIPSELADRRSLVALRAVSLGITPADRLDPADPDVSGGDPRAQRPAAPE
jgi:SAM-dependent methyltransferase